MARRQFAWRVSVFSIAASCPCVSLCSRLRDTCIKGQAQGFCAKATASRTNDMARYCQKIKMPPPLQSIDNNTGFVTNWDRG
ncbi:MAG: hypothetical protein E5Y73_31550 [Mesorhizobium sp.]|nr:MAG: hypothetical protein E5Y83_25450 [Mesorhizobium sp.]TIL84811.1 MAG: hypothetical protein E5Y73_31550 [Mesorhizobium sp.]TIR28199.1 MAG: hypothetical protein E5X35_31625 [Mesorhizobium sp.]